MRKAYPERGGRMKPMDNPTSTAAGRLAQCPPRPMKLTTGARGAVV